MSRPKFSTEELKPTGKFYPTSGAFLGMEIPPDPVLNKPITPRENWKLMFEGKKPYWIPIGGFVMAESVQFRPRIHPDNIANHQVMDGGPAFDFSGYGKTIKGLNDLEWCWIDDIMGATMMPGKPKVPDINKWEDYISFPDLDGWDWDTLAKQNLEYLGTDKMNQLGIQCGLWERLMAMMDVVEACVALYDDDLKPGVHRFFDVYSNWIIDYIGRVADNCRIDSVMLHEDWAHQRGPFFSPNTAREMLLPYIQKIVNYCHSRGIAYEIHCCGACEMLIPVFIETGADMWGGQVDLNDMEGYAKQYKDSSLIFGVMMPDLGPEADIETVRKAAKDWVEEFKDCKIIAGGMRPMADMMKPFHPMLQNFIYEYSRIAFQDEE